MVRYSSYGVDIPIWTSKIAKKEKKVNRNPWRTHQGDEWISVFPLNWNFWTTKIFFSISGNNCLFCTKSYSSTFDMQKRCAYYSLHLDALTASSPSSHSSFIGVSHIVLLLLHARCFLRIPNKFITKYFLSITLSPNSFLLPTWKATQSHTIFLNLT